MSFMVRVVIESKERKERKEVQDTIPVTFELYELAEKLIWEAIQPCKLQCACPVKVAFLVVNRNKHNNRLPHLSPVGLYSCLRMAMKMELRLATKFLLQSGFVCKKNAPKQDQVHLVVRKLRGIIKKQDYFCTIMCGTTSPTMGILDVTQPVHIVHPIPKSFIPKNYKLEREEDMIITYGQFSMLMAHPDPEEGLIKEKEHLWNLSNLVFAHHQDHIFADFLQLPYNPPVGSITESTHKLNLDKIYLSPSSCSSSSSSSSTSKPRLKTLTTILNNLYTHT
jgi:hypothetical protein